MAETNYDEQFEQNPPVNNMVDPPKKRRSNTMSGVSQAISTGVVGMDTGFGQSSFDKEIDFFTDVDKQDPRGSLNEMRSMKQGAWYELGAGLGRTISKAATEIAKTPGIVGGLAVGTAEAVADGVTGEDKHDFLETAFNNPWVQSMDKLNEYVGTEALPVYVSKAVEDGDLFTKLLSPEFWATDGADGIGFAIGAMFPGQYFSGLGLGAKLMNQVNKVDKWADFAKSITRAEDLVKASSKLGLTPANIDSGIAIAYNTLSEAGAEAKGIGDSLEMSKPDILKGYQKSYIGTKQYGNDRLGLLEEMNHKVDSGEMSIDEFNQLASDENYLNNELLERRFADQKSKAQANVFGTNLAILLGPNTIMHNRLFGKFSKEAKSITKAEKLSLEGLSKGQKALKTVEHLGKKAAPAVKGFATNLASEGLWEEGMQTTVEKLFSGRAKQGNLTTSFFDTEPGELASEYIKTMSTTEGQVAAALGGIIGSGMTGVQHALTSKARQEQENSILTAVSAKANQLNNIFNVSDIYKRDEKTGAIKYKENADGSISDKPEIDVKKASQYATSLALNDITTKRFDAALKAGDVDTVEDIKRQALLTMMLPAVMTGEKGLATLEQQLRQLGKSQDFQAKENDLKSEHSYEDFVKTSMGLANHLLTEKNKFEDFKDPMIDLSYVHPDVPGLNYVKLREEFLNEIGGRYLDAKSQLYTNERQLKRLEKRRTDALKELNQDTVGVAEETGEKTYPSSPLLDTIMKDINAVEKRIAKNNKDIAEVWDGKSASKAYEEFIEDNIKADKEFSDINQVRINNVLDKLDGIKSIEELDRFEKGLDKNFKKNPFIAKKIEGIRQTFKDEAKAVRDQENAKVRKKAKDKKIEEEDAEPIDKTDEELEDELDEELDDVPPGDEDDEIIPPDTEDLDEEDNEFEGDDDSGTDTLDEEDIDTSELTALEKAKIETKPMDLGLVTDVKSLPKAFQNFLEFLRRPIRKIKQHSPVVKFTITPRAEHNHVPTYDKMVEFLKNIKELDDASLETLTEYLPISLEFEHNGKISRVPLLTLTEKNTKQFNNYNKDFRRKLVEAYFNNGRSFEGITTKFTSQYGGRLNLTDTDNSIKDLQIFSGKSNYDIAKNLKDNLNMFYLNRRGKMKNAFTLAFDNRLSVPSGHKGSGEVYMVIKNNAGEDVPIKLNTSRIKGEKATGIYNLLKAISIATTNAAKGQDLYEVPLDSFFDFVERTDKETVDSLKKEFAKELELFEKMGKGMDENTATVGELLKVLSFVNSTNAKTLLKQLADSPNFQFGTLGKNEIGEVTSEDFVNDTKKEEIESFLSLKRHNVMITDEEFNFNNPHYLEYLLDADVLTTNIIPFDKKNPIETSSFTETKEGQGSVESIYFSNNLTIPKPKVVKPEVKPQPKKTVEVKKAEEGLQSTTSSLLDKYKSKTPLAKVAAEDAEVETKPEVKKEVKSTENFNEVDRFLNKFNDLKGTKDYFYFLRSLDKKYNTDPSQYNEWDDESTKQFFIDIIQSKVEPKEIQVTDKVEKDLRTVRKGDKLIYFTNLKGLRQNWETDRQVTVKAISKLGVLFEGDKDWKNFNEGWHNFTNLTKQSETTTGKVETKPAETQEVTSNDLTSFINDWNKVTSPQIRNQTKAKLLNVLDPNGTLYEYIKDNVRPNKDLPKDFAEVYKEDLYETIVKNNITIC